MNRPNIIVIYADDLGFGDIGCYGGTGVPTPNLDRLAAQGLRFTNGYATAATCTPSRYSLLTGTYSWRNPRAHILAGDAPIIIGQSEATLPRMLQSAGYRTAAIGKWHLGLGDGNLNWNQPIHPCPNDVGFDESFIMAATNDRVPCVYVENGRVVNLDPNDPIEVTFNADAGYPGLPTGRTHPHLLKMMYSHGHDMTIVNGVSRIGHMRGGTAALWDDQTMAEVFADRAKQFITARREQPFFLYYALHQPHVPRIPGPRFEGSTKLGPRGDVIAELDWCVGEVLRTLEENGLAENTLVIFSSDNGPVLDDGYQDRAAELTGDHRPAGPLRGGKYSLYDGGTRVPLIVRWPREVKPGTSDALVSQVDFYASFSALLGAALPPAAAPDSENVLSALTGTSPTGRQELVSEGIGAKTLLRRENWVFIPPHPGPAMNTHTNTELGNSAEPQLYDLSRDIGQIHNEAEERPDVVAQLWERLNNIRVSTRTRSL